MPDPTIYQSEKMIIGSDIDILENSLGFVFPKQIREFYLSHNGGVPHPNCFEKNGEYWKINEFLSIKYGVPGNKFEDAFVRLVKEGEDFFPREIIPIALDAGGDVFCFRVSPIRIGSICCWIAEEYNSPDRAVVELASDFNSFVNALTHCPD